MTAFQKWAAALSMIAMTTPALATVSVPEPGTLGLLACGLAGFVAITLRRRK